MKSIQEKFIGAWRLVHSVEYIGDDTVYPFDKNATGLIVYDISGYMSVQITRKNRSKYKENEFKKSSIEELQRIPSDYLAYFGTYEIDDEKSIVTHRVEGCIYPNRVGRLLDRKFQFYDNKLSLKPHDGSNREILWERCV